MVALIAGMNFLMNSFGKKKAVNQEQSKDFKEKVAKLNEEEGLFSALKKAKNKH